MSNQIKNVKEETLTAIQRLVELLSNPENQHRLFAMLADMDGEKEARDVEKEKVVITPVTDDKTEDDDECASDCIGCKVSAFLEDYPGYAPYFEELRERYMNDEMDEEAYVEMLYDYLLMATSDVTRMKYKPENLPGFVSSRTPEVKTQPETKLRKRDELERSVPWGRNNPSSLTSRISITSDKYSIAEGTKPDMDAVTVNRHNWLNLNVELIKQRSIIAALYEYSKGLEKQLEIESGIELESFKFEL